MGSVRAPSAEKRCPIVGIADSRRRASVAERFDVSVEHANALKAKVKIEGKHVARNGATFIDFALRLSLCANRPDLTFMRTFYCREPCEGTTEIKVVRLVMPTRMDPAATKLMHQINHGHCFWPRFVQVGENVEVVSSSVNEIDDYRRDYQPYQSGALFLRSFASLNEDLSEHPVHMYPRGDSPFRAEYATGGVRQVHP